MGICSLERRLEEHGTCYGNLIQDIRIVIAKCLLETQDYTVTEVSNLLKWERTPFGGVPMTYSVDFYKSRLRVNTFADVIMRVVR